MNAPGPAADRALRVCMLIESYAPVVGGMERQAAVLAEGLVARGVEMRVLTRRTHARLPAAEERDGVAVRRVGPTGPRRGARWAMVLTVLPWLIRHRRRYDLVFVAGFRTLGLAAVLLRALTRKPCVLKADSRGEMSGAFFEAGLRSRGWGPRGRIVRLGMGLRQRLLRRGDAFVSLSEEMTGELAAHGVARDRIRTIPNAVDTNVFRPVETRERAALRAALDLEPEATVFVYTGRLVTYKGLPHLLEAWRGMPQDAERPVRLLLVGGGGDDMHNCEDALRAFVRTHGLDRSVRFTGEIDAVHRVLQASDVFVFPTEEEAFGLSLVEAMACGLPSIATRVGGVADILEDGVNGLAVPVRAVDALAAAMRRLLADRELRERLGTAARETARSRYALDAVCDAYLALFRSVSTAQA